MKFEIQSKELQEKLKGCKTIEELTDLAKLEGVELSDEVLGSVSGGDKAECTVVCTQYDPNCVDALTVC